MNFTPNVEQVKTAVQWLIGVLTPILVTYGLTPDKIGLWGTLAGQVVPPVAMFCWAIWERTHKNTLATAGAILQAPTRTGEPSGTIVISPQAGNGAKAAAIDDNVGNVNFGNVSKALASATTQSSWFMGLAALLLCAPLLGACGVAQIASTPVSTVKAQQAIDLSQSIHKATVQAEVIYLKQPGCGLPASPPAPLCASYAVGLRMKSLDDTATKAIADAQKTIDAAGPNPAAIDAAVAAANFAVTQFQNFTAAYGAKK